MKIHPYAELFPPLDNAALRKLAEDIGINGLKQPIWVLDGQILDGRNRWNACEIAQVKCRTVDYTGNDPLGFVISMNLRRRQLSPSQLAMIGVEIEAYRANDAEKRKAVKCKELASRQPRDASGKLGKVLNRVPQFSGELGRVTESARQAAKELGVNHDYISKAKRISRSAPELVGLVKAGELKLQDATILAKMPKPQRKQVFAYLDSIHDIKKAIAKAKIETSSPKAKATTTTPWVATEELTRLRNCFVEVLTTYVANANGEFESLIACINVLMTEAMTAQQDSRPKGNTSVGFGNTTKPALTSV